MHQSKNFTLVDIYAIKIKNSSHSSAMEDGKSKCMHVCSGVVTDMVAYHINSPDLSP